MAKTFGQDAISTIQQKIQLGIDRAAGVRFVNSREKLVFAMFCLYGHGQDEIMLPEGKIGELIGQDPKTVRISMHRLVAGGLLKLVRRDPATRINVYRILP